MIFYWSEEYEDVPTCGSDAARSLNINA